MNTRTLRIFCFILYLTDTSGLDTYRFTLSSISNSKSHQDGYIIRRKSTGFGVIDNNMIKCNRRPDLSSYQITLWIQLVFPNFARWRLLKV